MPEYPEKLLVAYAKWSKNMSSDRLFKEYDKQITNYLKSKATDDLERCRLMVLLYGAARKLGYIKDNKSSK